MPSTRDTLPRSLLTNFNTKSIVNRENKTINMITTNEEEILEKLVREDHAFRKIKELVNFYDITSPYYALNSGIGAKGIDIVKNKI